MRNYYTFTSAVIEDVYRNNKRYSYFIEKLITVTGISTHYLTDKSI